MKTVSDPVLLEVIHNAFRSIAEEMGKALVRSAYSPNIRVRKDCSCAVFDRTGRLITQAEHIPAHLGPMAAVIKAVFDKYSEEELAPGDVVICNDSYLPGGSHLPDISVITPVFHDNRIAFFVANRAHHNDVGGMSPGSQSADAKEIYQEGLRIPVIKIQQGGALNRELLEFICLNVRTPDERQGDILAQVSANNVGSDRLQELICRYGIEQLYVCIEELIAYAERMLRQGIEAIPDGVYEGEDFLEGAGEDLIRIKTTITIKGGTAHVDFTGTQAQVHAPYNCPPDQAKASVYYVFKCIAGEDTPFNYGVFKPITFNLPVGTIVNPLPPAAAAFCTTEVANRIVDPLIRSLSQAVPEKATAGWATTRNVTVVGGIRSDSRTPFVHLESFGGGQGARSNKDGMDAVPPHMGNTANAPAEIIETAYPLLVLSYGLVRDSEGPGKFRGGLGVKRELKLLECAGAEMSLVADRRRLPPYGLFGGKPAKVGEDYLIRNGEKRHIKPKCVMELFPNDVIIIQTPGGGGRGDPWERDPMMVAKEVREKLVSAERAEREYGVVFDENGELDMEKTLVVRRARTCQKSS